MNVIEFSCPKEYLDISKDTYPTPIKTNLPEWYKKLEFDYVRNRTIKGCMPFLETLLSGYLLKLPVDIHIQHMKKEGRDYSNIEPSSKKFHDYCEEKKINLNFNDYHPVEQLKGCPFEKKNGLGFPYRKLINPWKIKTPPGYSCLFLNPMNNTPQDFFEIVPGIVHTDQFELEVNFPIILNKEKYGDMDLLLKKGLPYVQVIPYKRENWKMNITESNPDKTLNEAFKLSTVFSRFYKNLIFNKNKTKWL